MPLIQVDAGAQRWPSVPLAPRRTATMIRNAASVRTLHQPGSDSTRCDLFRSPPKTKNSQFTWASLTMKASQASCGATVGGSRGDRLALLEPSMVHRRSIHTATLCAMGWTPRRCRMRSPAVERRCLAVALSSTRLWSGRLLCRTGVVSVLQWANGSTRLSGARRAMACPRFAERRGVPFASLVAGCGRRHALG